MDNVLKSIIQGQSGVNMHDVFKRTALHVSASEGKVNKISNPILSFKTTDDEVACEPDFNFSFEL